MSARWCWPVQILHAEPLSAVLQVTASAAAHAAPGPRLAAPEPYAARLRGTKPCEASSA